MEYPQRLIGIVLQTIFPVIIYSVLDYLASDDTIYC